jgi:hypothetical protein
MSEIDFLIVTRDTVLVIEVKGGRLGRRDGVWTFIDRYGHVNTKREGPFEQARSAMFALKDLVATRRPGLTPEFGYLVITPDQDLGDDIEWERVHHAGPRAMTVEEMTTAVQAALRFWGPSRKGASDQYGHLLKLLRPDFDLIPSLQTRISSLQQEYVQLAERQYELLAGAERNRRILCLGGAGSGKTLLALETARRSAADGSNVVVTCRSKGLARLLAASASKGVKVVPFEQLYEVSPPCDVLIVDEAQDLMDVDSYLQLNDVVEGGLDNGTWRIFCDPNNQAHIDGDFDPDVLDMLQERAVVIDLPYNCRNTVPVVHQTQLLTGADLGVARAGEGPTVEFCRSSTDADAAAQLDAHLKHLRQDEVDLAEVVVITVRDSTSDSAAVSTKAYRSRHLTLYDGDPTRTTPGVARLMTSREAKGLEAPHVCLLDIDDLNAPASVSHLYVGMTRSTISLWMSLSVRAWEQLSTPKQPGVTVDGT